MALVDLSVRANVGGTPQPQHGEGLGQAFAQAGGDRGWVLSSSRARAWSCAWASSALSAW